MNTETVTRWMHACAESISEQRDYLTQLDAAIGDADHGANMTRGFSAVEAKLDGLEDGTTPGRGRLGVGRPAAALSGDLARSGPGGADRGTRRGRRAAHDRGDHDSSATVRSRAARMRAVEVAPGS